MKRQLTIGKGKSVLQWLLLALLLTNVVCQNHAEPRSVYRIEEIISAYAKPNSSLNFSKVEHSRLAKREPFVGCSGRNIQFKHLQRLSRNLHLETELAISNAPDTLLTAMQATGQFFNNQSLTKDAHFISIS